MLPMTALRMKTPQRKQILLVQALRDIERNNNFKNRGVPPSLMFSHGIKTFSWRFFTF